MVLVLDQIFGKRWFCAANADVHGHQFFLELFANCQQPAVPVDDHALSVEYQLVLSADSVGVGNDDPALLRPFGDHGPSFFSLALMERRCVDVHDHFSACKRLYKGRPFGIPDVLTDVDADGDALDRDGVAAVARFEVPVFVEHAVVRQEDLLVGIDMLPAVQDRSGVIQVFVPAVDETDDGRDSSGRPRDLFERAQIVLHELRLQDQVLGWIAGHGQFGKGDDISAELFRAVDIIDDLVPVPLEVAHNRVDLCHGYADSSHN